MATFVVFYSRILAAIDERLTSLTWNDSVILADDVQHRQVLGQREPIRKRRCFGLGEETADGNYNCC